MALGRTFQVAPLVLLLLAVAACVPQNSAPKAGNAVAPTATDLTAPQPRTATYNCADGGRMTIENLGTSLRVLGPDGTSEDCRPRPPTRAAGSASHMTQS